MTYNKTVLRLIISAMPDMSFGALRILLKYAKEVSLESASRKSASKRLVNASKKAQSHLPVIAAALYVSCEKGTAPLFMFVGALGIFVAVGISKAVQFLNGVF